MTSTDFYPRPPRGGRRYAPSRRCLCDAFLSTPSARRATSAWAGIRPNLQHFYPRPPRGGRRLFGFSSSYFLSFLSTPSARRATKKRSEEKENEKYFYPRPPRGGRPHAGTGLFQQIPISIHALREEGDPVPEMPCSLSANFYPRPPRGGRHGRAEVDRFLHTFLSTPSARRATVDAPVEVDIPDISIHALREEGDLRRSFSRPVPCNFYPRPPRGGRLKKSRLKSLKRRFLSTPSARRATQNVDNPAINSDISIHALREEGDRDSYRFSRFLWDFYPRPPRGGRPQKRRA